MTVPERAAKAIAMDWELKIEEDMTMCNKYWLKRERKERKGVQNWFNG